MLCFDVFGFVRHDRQITESCFVLQGILESVCPRKRKTAGSSHRLRLEFLHHSAISNFFMSSSSASACTMINLCSLLLLAPLIIKRCMKDVVARPIKVFGFQAVTSPPIIDERQPKVVCGADRQAPAKAGFQLPGSSPADKPAALAKQTAAKAGFQLPGSNPADKPAALAKQTAAKAKNASGTQLLLLLMLT